MRWKEEREKLEQVIESNIDWRWEEMQFGETLLDMLRDVPNKESFMRKARRVARAHPDPWIRDELFTFVDNLAGNVAEVD
jgi:hypothetical protein